MASALPTNIELFDYADTRLGTTISLTSPSNDLHEPTNLLNKQDDQSPDTIGGVGVGRGRGFMAESFVKPPTDLTLTFPHPITIASIQVDPRIRQSSAKSISIFIPTTQKDSKWTLVGRMTWNDGEEGKDTAACALYNRDLSPQTISSSGQRGGVVSSGVRWEAVELPPHFLLSVPSIKVRVSAMHQAHAPGFGRIEVWAQPSQRLLPQQRAQTWTHVRQALRPPTPPLPASGELANPSCYPQEFIDSITLSPMWDPVMLPSGVRCDRSTIERHWKRSQTDPFTGLALDIEQ
ncbi:RING finger protein 37, partial [Coemansia aciculifera]